MRALGTQIRDYEALVDQVALTLKPGGLVDLTEFDFRVYGTDRRPLPVDAGASAVARWMHLAHRAVQMQGGEPDAANHLHEWIARRACFYDVRYYEWWFQTTTWNRGIGSDAECNVRHR